MANFYISPNMSLVVPIPTVTIGPDWANDINVSLTIIDGHTHNAGSGIPITPNGLNLNSDVSFLTNNGIQLRSARFAPNASPLGLSTDLGCIYEAGVDLYYNDGNGNQIRITQSGSLAGAAGTITGLPSGTASAAFVSANGTFVFQQATSTAANMDIGSLIIRYPGSYPTPAGAFIALEAPSSLASGYALTLPPLPSSTNVMTLGNTGIITSITYDNVGQNMTVVGANAIAGTMDATGVNSIVGTMSSSSANAIGMKMTGTGANAILASATSTVANPAAIGQIALSNSSGAFSTTSLTEVSVCNTTLTTSGRPVFVSLIPDGSSNAASIGSQAGASVAAFFLRRDGVLVSISQLSSQPTLIQTVPPNCVAGIDPVGAGTHNYTLTALTTGGTAFVSYSIIMAYEL